jgi:importin subunit beta-1
LYQHVSVFLAIQLKNAIYSKEETIKVQYQERWLQITEDVRNYIKNNCIESLGTETRRPSQAAQCVGYIACAELPRGIWPDCISKYLFLNILKALCLKMAILF